MPAALLVLVLVAFLPYLLAGLGGYLRIKQLGSFDNHHPRQQASLLQGSGARAMAAQSNAWEALALYTATILVVWASGIAWEELATPALVFAIARVAHPIFYVADIAVARTAAFLAGLFSCVYMISKAF
ncbi:MAG: MAPEG family protein [Pseudomonadales bacterium]